MIRTCAHPTTQGSQVPQPPLPLLTGIMAGPIIDTALDPQSRMLTRPTIKILRPADIILAMALSLYRIIQHTTPNLPYPPRHIAHTIPPLLLPYLLRISPTNHIGRAETRMPVMLSTSHHPTPKSTMMASRTSKKAFQTNSSRRRRLGVEGIMQPNFSSFADRACGRE